MPKKSRSAKTGRFASLAYTKKHPATTVTETRKTRNNQTTKT